MRALDDIDRRLIFELRNDSRVTVKALAETLHVSRGTAQARLDRLLRDGVIRRFTIEVGPGAEEDVVRAVTTIQVTGSTAGRVARHLRGMATVREVHTTNGTWDLVAELTAPNLVVLDATLNEIRSLAGVANTETSILLRSL
ncbi:DNA-binding Lrp family transcriptional regulator [Kineosphaera limosa]|uniref:Putative AsnC family transcriptional regulator n=1 Tax=Kineosphaera limosa NBRC 100340 TaxID=1184609 RepID=K6WK60_9MICO|nr:Lrp/AsnC family transcriptional regulator [Kineosphaera limosa]NYE02326.1 DNA-binding Lrp family transcriptional regulator [Kineosphaera limosa]GAB94181.1 putative AsnC family transcriptional regulator [Kineosphaera limosa NBRC 100340]